MSARDKWEKQDRARFLAWKKRERLIFTPRRICSPRRRKPLEGQLELFTEEPNDARGKADG